MEVVRGVFKYLNDSYINEIKMDNFTTDSVHNFFNYSPIVSNAMVSTNPVGFVFNTINPIVPIIYNLDCPTNLSNMKSVEIDVYSPVDIDKENIILSLCSGINGNAVRGIYKNSNELIGGTLTTLVFDLGNINNSRILRHLSSIKSIKLGIKENNIILCGITATNSEYNMTYDDLKNMINASVSYILDKINQQELPIHKGLLEAVYKLTAYYIWERKATELPREKKQGMSYLKTEVDELIKYYLTNGYHPHLIPFTNKTKRKEHHSISDNISGYETLLNIINVKKKELIPYDNYEDFDNETF